ncbi:MAG: hypothetical protein IT164_04880 [Bryobacterales bacterium]|nr:hypothetical protein [Bryobacterales bacterium]
MKMKLEMGAEPRKVAMLAGLLAVAGAAFYTDGFTNFGGSPAPAGPAPSSAPAPARPNPITSIRQAEAATASASAGAGQSRSGRSQASVEFRPSLKPKRPEEQVDLSKVDPALRLDLLAKLQRVTLQGQGRSLFDFGAAPPPKLPEPKIIPGRTTKKKGGGTETMPEVKPPEIKAAEPAKPPAPPIPLKFYGFIESRPSGGKRAFFLQGEDIFVAGEGETIKSRFKVVRIGINAATVEDVQYKNQQSLPLEAAPGS